MPSRNVLVLSDILFFLSLNKNLLSISCMIDVECRVAFEGKHCIINYCSLASPRMRGLPLHVYC
jgi:hypothetical protein